MQHTNLGCKQTTGARQNTGEQTAPAAAATQTKCESHRTTRSRTLTPREKLRSNYKMLKGAPLGNKRTIAYDTGDNMIKKNQQGSAKDDRKEGTSTFIREAKISPELLSAHLLQPDLSQPTSTIQW